MEKRLFIVSFLVLMLTLPFLNKAFHFDDVFFIYVARQMVKDPLHPYSFDMEFAFNTAPATRMTDPPLMSGYIGAIILLFGEAEWILHLSYVIFPLIAGISMYYIAKKFTDNVHSYRWQDDFSKARNYSISKATKDWILILDADERLSKKDLIRLRSIIKNSPKDILGYRFIQKTYHGRKVVSIRGICRLFRNKKSIRFVYPIHETVRESIKEKGGRIGKTGIIIKHYSSLNQKKTDYYLRLLKQKLQTHPGSSAQKEIELENKLATLH